CRPPLRPKKLTTRPTARLFAAPPTIDCLIPASGRPDADQLKYPRLRITTCPESKEHENNKIDQACSGAMRRTRSDRSGSASRHRTWNPRTGQTWPTDVPFQFRLRAILAGEYLCHQAGSAGYKRGVPGNRRDYCV